MIVIDISQEEKQN